MPRLYEVNNAEVVKHVQQAFEISDIDKVWQYLGKKFGFNIPAWQKEFGDYFNPEDRDKNMATQFMEFGKIKVEPILNDILRRTRHPTWIYMLAYILRDKIEKIKQRNELYKNRYR